MSSKVLLPLLAILMALPACKQGPKSAPAPVRTARPLPPKPLTPEQELARIVRTTTLGVTSGAGEVPVEVRFDLPSPPLEDQPFELSIALLPAEAVPSLKVEVSSTDALTVIEPTTPVVLDMVAAGTMHHLDFKAQGKGTGIRVITVTLTGEFPGGAQSRSFSYPVLIRPPGAGAPST
jgi:hypothetical protein